MLPNEILKGRLVRGVQRFFAIQADPPAPQLSPEISAGLDLMHPSTDFSYLLGERLASCFCDVTGDATHPAFVQLYNPTGSGQLLVVDGFWLSGLGSAIAFYVRDANGATLQSGTTTQGRVRDARWFAQVAVGQIRGAVNQAAAGVILLALETDSLGALYYSFPYVLTPGTWLSLTTVGNAARLFGGFMWTERPLEDLEARQP